MEKILGLAREKAQAAEVFLVRYEQSPVIFEANRLKQMHARQGMSVALRLIKDGRIGLATSTRLDDAEGLVERAVAVSEFGSQARFELPGQSTYPKVDILDEAVAGVPLEHMVELGEKLIAGVRRHTPEVLCDAGVSRSSASVQIINSSGEQVSFRRSYFSIGLEGNLIRDTDMLFVGDGESSCRPIGDVSGLIRNITDQLEYARVQASLRPGPMPVVFTPNGVVSALVSPLAVAFNGRTVLQGASPVGHRRGETLFNERVTVKDDPLAPYRPSSRPFDDEGVPSQVTYLIREGKVDSFLYDLQTAGQAGTRSTGSADRGGGASLPGPSTSGFVFETGDIAYEDMVTGMDEGLVVEQLMGASQTNILGGEFSGNVLLGFKVEKGKIAGRVKDTVVSGNVYEALRDLIGLGKEGRWVGSVYTPAIGCAKLTVGCRG